MQDISILTADITDAASLDSVARRSKVIIALAGPYAKLGTPVVEACVRNRTHYVDITGDCFHYVIHTGTKTSRCWAPALVFSLILGFRCTYTRGQICQVDTASMPGLPRACHSVAWQGQRLS